MKFFNKSRFGAKLLLLIFFAQACTDHVPPGGDGGPIGEPGTDFPSPKEGSIYLLAEGNLVYEVDVRNTTQAIDVIKVDTQYPNEKILSIDFRPATGQLYAISNYAVMYVVNVNANRVGKAIPINPNGTEPQPSLLNENGFDFDPVLDKIRVSDVILGSKRHNPENFFLDNQNGNPVGLNAGLFALAYSNNYSGATSTALFGIDAGTDRLVRLNDREARELEIVGSLGTNIDQVGGFDIAAATSYQPEYGLASVRRGEKWELELVDLASGKMRKFGDAPAGNKIIGLAIPTAVAYAIDQEQKLLAFNPADHHKGPNNRIVEKHITGLPSGVKLLGLDLSVTKAPKLYALGDNSRIYEIDHVTGSATENCRLSMSLELAGNPSAGIDFDPYDNKLRVVTSTYKNFKVELGTGLVTELNLVTQEGDVISLNAGAYTNSQVGLTNPGFTYFYGLSSATKAFYKMDPATFALTKIGNLDIEASMTDLNGFDIGGVRTEYGYGIFTRGGLTGVHVFELERGVVFDFFEFPRPVTGFTLGRYVPVPRN